MWGAAVLFMPLTHSHTHEHTNVHLKVGITIDFTRHWCFIFPQMARSYLRWDTLAMRVLARVCVRVCVGGGVQPDAEGQEVEIVMVMAVENTWDHLTYITVVIMSKFRGN